MANTNARMDSFEAVKSAGDEIVQIADEIQKLLNDVSMEMEKIGGEAWQSSNATAFKNEFDNLSADFNKVHASISSMGAAISRSSEIYSINEGTFNA